MALAATTEYLISLLRSPPPQGGASSGGVKSAKQPASGGNFAARWRRRTPPSLDILSRLSSDLRRLENDFFGILPPDTLETIKPQIPSDLRHEGELLFMALGLKAAVLVTLPPCTVPKALLIKHQRSSSGTPFIDVASANGWIHPNDDHVMLSDLYAGMVLHPVFQTLDAATAAGGAGRLVFRKVRADVTSPTTETFEGSYVVWNADDIEAHLEVGRMFFRSDGWYLADAAAALSPPSPPPEDGPKPPLKPVSPTRTSPTPHPAAWAVSEKELAALLDYPGTLPALPGATPDADADDDDEGLQEFVEVAYLDRRRRIVTRVVSRPVVPRARTSGTRGGRGSAGTGRGSRRGRSTTSRIVAGSSVPQRGTAHPALPISTPDAASEAEAVETPLSVYVRPAHHFADRSATSSSASGSASHITTTTSSSSASASSVSFSAATPTNATTASTSLASSSSACSSEDETYFDDEDDEEGTQAAAAAGQAADARGGGMVGAAAPRVRPPTASVESATSAHGSSWTSVGPSSASPSASSVSLVGAGGATPTPTLVEQVVEEVEEEELVLVTTFGAVRSEMEKVMEHFRAYRRAARGVMDLALWTSL
ncbi:hypothetical protein HDU96_011014 [Phlyctochytrium bullatum]|nr:hypothetical protein HDU96_011014 [Phlyctochytrium bullatum]